MIPQVQVGAQPCRGAWLRTSTGQQHTHVHTHTHTRPIIARNTAGTHIHRTGHDMEDRGRRARLSSLGPHRTPLEAQAPVAMPCPQAQLCWILRAGPAPTMTPTGSWPWARKSLCHNFTLKSTAIKTQPGLGPACVPSKPAELVGLCWVNPASCRDWAIPWVQLLARCWGSGHVLLCCRQAASRLKRPGSVPRSWQHV